MGVDLNKIKKTLIDRYPFFGGLIDDVEYFETPNCLSGGVPTAGTNGKTIYYHPEICKYSEKQQLFLFAHEISHIAFDHIKRGKDKDQKVWNVAADAVINAHLKKDGLELLPGSIDYPWAIKYDVEEVYKKLLKEKNDKNKQNQNSNSSANNEQGHDDHELWDENFLENDNNEQSKKIKENLVKMGEKEAFNDKEESPLKKALEKLLEKLKQEKAEKNKKVKKTEIAKIYVGDSSYEEEIKFEDVGYAYPLINWPLYLKRPTEIVELDWSYKNAYLEDGVLISSLEETAHRLTHETEIVLDTSGSIDSELLKCFLRECKNILNFSKIKVGCFDVNFYGFTEIKNTQDIERLHFVGRGGTNFNVAVRAFSKTADNKIIFTDGQAPMPYDDCADIIWVVFGGYHIKPRGGKVIYVDENQLRKSQKINCLSQDEDSITYKLKR